MTEYAGAGDHRRSMELLWGRFEPPARGPRRDLDVGAIAAAAVAVADAEGLAAVSMRRVAKELGRGPMTLYTYVPSKQELIELMLERVLGELPTGYDRSGGWRPAAEGWARANWAFYDRHPWTLQISVARALLSPNEFATFEASVAMFNDAGMTTLQMLRAVGSLTSFVRGAAKAVADTRTAEQATGVAEADWWRERSALLEEVAVDADWANRYPTLARLDAEGTFAQPERTAEDTTGYIEREELDAFEYGLALMLDGIAAQLAAPGATSKQ